MSVSEDALTVDLDDGRTIIVPVQWYPRLAHANVDELQNFELSYSGVHWPVLDEDISIQSMLLGRGSGESRKSFKRWLEYRAKGETPWLNPDYQRSDYF